MTMKNKIEDILADEPKSDDCILGHGGHRTSAKFPPRLRQGASIQNNKLTSKRKVIEITTDDVEYFD